MSTKETKPKKPHSSTKKATTAHLEAKIAELEAKLASLSAQVKPAETRPSPPPPPKPAETRPSPPPPPKPAETRPSPPPPPKVEEVAAAYSSVSSASYSGNRYFATRQRLAYHPPDKQFRRGQVTVTVQVSPPPKVEAPEPQPAPKEEPRRIEPPVPRIRYTGNNYFATRQRLAYHPPDKQFMEAKLVIFEETPSAANLETSQLEPSQTSSQSKPRSSWKAKGHM